MDRRYILIRVEFSKLFLLLYTISHYRSHTYLIIRLVNVCRETECSLPVYSLINYHSRYSSITICTSATTSTIRLHHKVSTYVAIFVASIILLSIAFQSFRSLSTYLYLPLCYLKLFRLRVSCHGRHFFKAKVRTLLLFLCALLTARTSCDLLLGSFHEGAISIFKWSEDISYSVTEHVQLR